MALKSKTNRPNRPNRSSEGSSFKKECIYCETDIPFSTNGYCNSYECYKIHNNI